MWVKLTVSRARCSRVIVRMWRKKKSSYELPEKENNLLQRNKNKARTRSKFACVPTSVKKQGNWDPRALGMRNTGLEHWMTRYPNARYPTARRGIPLPGAPLFRHSASEAPSLTSNQYVGWKEVDVTIWVTETNSPGSLGWSCPRHVMPTITLDSGDKEQFCDGHNKNIPEGSGRTACKAYPYS